MSNIDEMGALIATQDNRATSDPIFVVQQRERIYGMDPAYFGGSSGGIEWIHDDEPDCSADDETGKRLESLFGEDGEDEREGYRRVCYVERWEWVQPFFTEKGANDYITANRHNLKEPRVYVASAYRNREWQGIRAAIAAAAPRFVRVKLPALRPATIEMPLIESRWNVAFNEGLIACAAALKARGIRVEGASKEQT